MNRTPRDNVRTSIFLPAKLHERIQNVADANKTSTSRVIRYILGEYFKNIQHKQEGVSSEKMDELIHLMNAIKSDTEKIKIATGAE
jgi:predicted DNA-binding protein